MDAGLRLCFLCPGRIEEEGEKEQEEGNDDGDGYYQGS